MADTPLCVGILEVHQLSTAFVVADVCVKAGDVQLVGIESNALGGMAVKLVGPTGDVAAGLAAGRAAAQQMHAYFADTFLPRFPQDGHWLIHSRQVYNSILEAYDHFLPAPSAGSADPNQDTSMDAFAIGMIETQGLAAMLEATDVMLKAGSVEVIGREKIGAAYVTILVRGDVASVRAAVAAGQQAVVTLGQKLICAHVIARPHADLLRLLPKAD